MLRDRGVADHHEVPWTRRETVDGSVLLHPLEERQEQGAAEEVGHVVELGAGDGDPGAVAGAGGQRAGEGGEPVGADPGAGLGAAGLGAFGGGGGGGGVVLLGGASDGAGANGGGVAGGGGEERERRGRGAEGERGGHGADGGEGSRTAARRRRAPARGFLLFDSSWRERRLDRWPEQSCFSLLET